MEDKTIVQQLEDAKAELVAKTEELATAKTEQETALEMAGTAEARADELAEHSKIQDELNEQLASQLKDSEEKADALSEEVAKLEGNLNLTAYDDISEGADAVEEVAEASKPSILEEWEKVKGTRKASTFWREHKSEIIDAARR